MSKYLATLALAMAPCSVSLMAQNRACQLLTPEEIKAATGIAFKAPEPVNTPNGDLVCGFVTAQGQRFSIAVHEKGGKAVFDTNKAKLSKQGRAAVTAAPGLGDDAYEVNRGPVSSISVLKGDRVIGLALIGVPDGLPKLRDLARKALARL